MKYNKIKHVLVSMLTTLAIGTLFALCFCLADMQIHWMIIIPSILIGFNIGVSRECGDFCSPNNLWNWRDIIANLIGVILGGLLLVVIFI